MAMSHRVLGRTLPTLGMVFALTALPTIDIPLLNGGGQSAAVATKVVRVSLAKAQKVSVAKAGKPTAVQTNPAPAVPDSAARTTGGSQVPPPPGRDDDLVADIPLSDGAGLVALSWAQAAQPNMAADLLFRTEGAKGWSAWRHIGPSGDTDSQAIKTTRVGTDPFWVPDATRIQVRASKGQASDLTNAELTVVTPSRGPAQSSPPASASAAANPTIISRAQWGADESLRGGCVPQIADTTKAAVVHHTAGSNDYAPGDSAGIVRGILAYHTQTLGWCDIGYNALVDRYGQTFEGRFGGLGRSVIGAHALGFNYRTFGVSMLGNFQEAPATQAAFTAVQNVIGWRLHNFYVSPTATTVLTSADSGSRYPAGTDVTLPVITGHRDTYYTECPGINVVGLLPNIRTETAKAAYYQDSIIYQRWARDGGAAVFGVVSSGEQKVPIGFRTAFTNNRVIYATWNGTAHIGSGVDDYFWSTGGINTWGVPSDEVVIKGGSRTNFSNGYAVIWTPSAGTQVTNGMILTYWDGIGAAGSSLGYPSKDMVLAGKGGYMQQFSGGKAWYVGGPGGRSTYAAIDAAYVKNGGPSSALGYPVAEQVVTSSGVYQRFQGGTVTVPNGQPPIITYS